MAEMDGGTHEGKAAVGDPVAARLGKFGDQAMGTQQLQEATALTTLTAAHLGVGAG
jgi:hypothetical protein